MLSALAGTVITQIASTFIGKALDAFVAYNNKQISMEELRTRVQEAMLDSFKAAEVAHADALAKTYASFMQTLAQSRLMQAVWASVVISQLFVLLWHQVGIPAYVELTGHRYPSSGTTVEWAYLLLAACLGMGPVVLRNGPGTLSTANIKAMLAK